MDKIRFSIIIPAYNAASFIERCLASVCEQNYLKDDYEVIVVDDCSPDNQNEVITKLQHIYPNICLICHKKNLRLGGARNTGIKHAKGEYVIFLDADDFWLSQNVLNKFHRLLSTATFDFIDSWSHASVTTYDGFTYNGDLCSDIETYNNASECLLSEHYKNAYAWSGVYCRQFLIDNDLWFREHAYYEDTDWKFRCIINAHKIGLIDFPFYGYYNNPNSITHKPSLFTFQQNISMADIMVNMVLSANISDEARHKMLSKYKKTPMNLVLASRNYTINETLCAIKDLQKSRLCDSKTYDSVSLLKRINFGIIKYMPFLYVVPIRFTVVCKRLISSIHYGVKF